LPQELSLGARGFDLEINLDWSWTLNLAVSPKEVPALDKVVDEACEELGIKIQTLDVRTRDRLVERILTLLNASA
jgi:hypothetical protein